ncbi:hypothetical protein F4809DRAFT_642551 [Biscogniauxia mediterranea]|nr:hypothetical protein F4809DRAFT_642551 [Biscogniauxia mediterranea]
MLRRRWYLTASLGREDEAPIEVPPYATAWILRFLVRIVVAVSLAGETYFRASTPSYQRDAGDLDFRIVLDPEVPLWLVLFSALLFLVDIAALAYSVVVTAITALYLYVWVLGLIIDNQKDDAEKALEEGRSGHNFEKVGTSKFCVEITECIEEEIDMLSDIA